MSNERIDLTYFQGITEKRGAMNYEVDENGMVGNILGIEMNQKDAAAIYNIPKFLAELKRCYEEIDMLISGHMRCEGCNEWIDTTAPYSLDHQMCDLPASE